MTSGIIALIVCFAAGTGFASGFPAADAERRSGGGMIGIERSEFSIHPHRSDSTVEAGTTGNCDRGHRQFAG
jgi:hypothetical protein